jgi:hypothetical protein
MIAQTYNVINPKHGVAYQGLDQGLAGRRGVGAVAHRGFAAGCSLADESDCGQRDSYAGDCGR